MTIQEAADKGYKVVYASPFEVGLLHGEKGVCTWWNTDFDGELPGLDHPTIMRAIELNEDILDNPRTIKIVPRE